MKKNLMFLALAAATVAGCTSGFKKKDGVLYDIVTDKSGPTIKAGDFVSVNVVAKTDGDSVMFSSYDAGKPSVFPMPATTQKNDPMAIMPLLSEGDSAIVKISADSIFKKGMPKPQGFKGKYVIYEFKINKVIAKAGLSDQVFSAKVEDYFKADAEKRKAAEPAAIKKYIDDNKLNLTKTDSGLYYTITTKGTGPVPAKGDTVVVNYVGKFLNGKVFDTNNKAIAQQNKTFNPMNPYKPIRVAVGMGQMIKGWDMGLMLLNKGSKATFIIPSNLAYGERGMQVVGPYTPLTFDVEVVDIVHPDPNAPKPNNNALMQQLQQQMQQRQQQQQQQKKII